MLYQTLDSFLRVGSVVVLARILMPADFGLVGMVTAITAVAERFKDFGLSTATVQQKSVTQEQVSKLFWINAAIGLGIAASVATMSPLLAHFFNDERVLHITLVTATGFLWSGLTIQHQAILQRQMKYTSIGGIQLGSTILSLAIATIFAIRGYGYWALVWKDVLRSLFIAAGTWLWCSWTPSAPRRHIDVGPLLKFGRDITAFNVIVSFTISVDQILIGKLYGATPLGIYRQAYQLMFWPINQLNGPVTRVAETTLSFLQDNADRYRRFYLKILTAVNFVMMPVVLFAAVYSDEIVLVVLGDKWVDAAPIFRIFALAAFIAPASDTTCYLLVSCGETKRYLNLGLLTSATLLLSFGIGAIWGPLGVAYGYLAATYMLLVLRLRYSFEGTPVDAKAFGEAIAKPVVASAAMMLALVLFNRLVNVTSALGLLTMSVPISLASYVGLWMVMPGGKEQLGEIVHALAVSLHLDRRAARP